MLDYHVDRARNFVTTRAAGRVTASDLAGHFVRLMRDPSFAPELNALIIVADVEPVSSPVGVGALAPLVRAWSNRGAGVKWAFVLPNRATRDFAESSLEQVKLTAVSARCFLSESAALTWLGAERTAAATEPDAADETSVTPAG